MAECGSGAGMAAAAMVALNGGTLEQQLIHDALPEIDLEAIDLSTDFLGHHLRLPILISSMTGGGRDSGLGRAATPPPPPPDKPREAPMLPTDWPTKLTLEETNTTLGLAFSASFVSVPSRTTSGQVTPPAHSRPRSGFRTSCRICSAKVFSLHR